MKWWELYEKEGGKILQEAGGEQALEFQRTLMMRFVGQGAETDLAIDNKPFVEWTKQEIRSAFDKIYEKLYGRTYPEQQVEFVTFKVRVSRPGRSFYLPKLKTTAKDMAHSKKGIRQAFSLQRKDYIPFDVYERSRLGPDSVIKGPAIIEEGESTIVIGEDGEARVDAYGFVWIEISS